MIIGDDITFEYIVSHKTCINFYINVLNVIFFVLKNVTLNICRGVDNIFLRINVFTGSGHPFTVMLFFHTSEVPTFSLKIDVYRDNVIKSFNTQLTKVK